MDTAKRTGARVAGPDPAAHREEPLDGRSLAPRGQEEPRAVRDPHPQAAARHLRAHAADGGRADEAGPARGRGRRDQGVRQGAREVDATVRTRGATSDDDRPRQAGPQTRKERWQSKASSARRSA